MSSTILHALRRFSAEAGLRFLSRRKTGLAVAVLTMALALGANTAVFSVLRAFLSSSLGLPDPESVFLVGPVRDMPGRGSVLFADAYPNFRLFRDTQRSFSAVACVFQSTASWETRGETRPLEVSSVTASFFATMGIRPLLGRTFEAREEGPKPAPVVILTHSFWQSAFAGDPNVLGTSMIVNGAPHTVIGVMPPGFGQPAPTDAWLPFDVPERFWTSVVGARQLSTYARLAPGVARQAAVAEMNDLTRRTLEADASANRDFRYSLRTLREALLAGADSTILLVQAGAAALLLLAVTNLASLLIAWGFERQQETAMRFALGARPWAVLRQFLLQSLVVVGVGGALGCGLAALALPLIQGLNPNPALASFLVGLTLDRGSLMFAAILTALTGLAAGVLPALHSRRVDVNETLKSSSRAASLARGTLRWQKAMVFSQAALSVVILSAAALVGLSFRNLLRVPGGFEATNRIVLRLNLPDVTYPSHPSRVAFARSLAANLETEGDIADYGFSSTLPVGDVAWGGRFFVELPGGEVAPEPMLFHFRRVSRGYLASLGIPLLQGRPFGTVDADSAPPVAIVSRALADRLWPGESALGKRLRRPLPGSTATEALEIVGVAGNAVDAGFGAPVGETVYVPWDQNSPNRLSLVVTPRTTPAAAITAARRALKGADPGLAAHDVATMDDLVWQANALPRLQAVLLLTFALVAIGITALGSYGVMSQLVATREREFGVRLAVGAAPLDLGGAVLFQNARLSAGGIGVGLVAAWMLGGLIRQFLVGIEPHSLPVLSAVAGGTLALTQLATVQPAWRAARLDVRKLVTGG